MSKISAIVLADKREDIIEGCFQSLKWVDEVILVNLGANAATLSIAKKYKCRLIKGTADYDFSAWRNQGAETARGEWLLYIDADERITTELQKEIQSIVHQPAVNAYKIPRKNYFLGKLFKSTGPDYQLRFFKKDSLEKWQGKIHEIPIIKGQIGVITQSLIHLSHRSLEVSLTNTLNWSKIEADNRFRQGHPIMTTWRFLRIICTGFWQEFVQKQIWREGVEGTIEGIYQVFSLFITYVRLWELQRKESLKETYQRIDRNLKH